jgi:hypothetical protein
MSDLMFETLVLLPLVTLLNYWFLFLPVYLFCGWFACRHESFGRRVFMLVMILMSLWGAAMLVGIAEVASGTIPPAQMN